MKLRSGCRRWRDGAALLPIACAFVVTVKAAAGDMAPAGQGLRYPVSSRTATTDVYHGVEVADPYRWLEDLHAPQTRAWIEAQNALTRQFMDALPARSHFASRLRQLLDYERFGVPRHENGRYVYTHNTGTQEQDTLWLTSNPAERGRLLIDPNAIRPDGTLSLADYQLSPDGRLLAYALSDGGSDWKTWHIWSLEAGRDLPEVLSGTKFTPVAWSRDSSGFYYSRYPVAPDGGYDDTRQAAIWYHRRGHDQSQDQHVFSVTDHPTRIPYPQVTEDGRFLVINVFDGYDTSGVYYQELGEDRPVVRLLDDWEARYEFLGHRGEELLVLTTRKAPAGRVMAIDVRKPGPGDWREVVPEGPQAIESAAWIGDRLVVRYLADASARVAVFAPDGRRVRDVSLPGRGSVEGFNGPSSRTETFFLYTDFVTPRTLFRYDLGTGQAKKLRAPASPVRPGGYVTEQVFYASRDGTRVPMFIVHRRGVPRDGRQPTVLYGYGGFNVSLSPVFSASRAAWLEAGGVLAVASLRGGGEYGEQWHLAGTKLNKQNVFDDFIAAAEWLIRERVTSREHLAIWGGSNGGLLVGAVLNQRPDLFAAAVPAVGVMDMLRYHTASANARQWASDYGLSEVPEEFRALRAYSPYHNLTKGACYPPVLVQADANDDRVLPWHSYKYAAALQHAQSCANPVLIRIETRSGHGAGASLSKIIGEYADQWAFVARVLGLAVP